METRAPRPGETCTCGRPAVTVYVVRDLNGEHQKDVPYCGIPDGGTRKSNN